MTSGSRARVKAEQVLQPLILAGPGPVTRHSTPRLVAPWARRAQEAAKGPPPVPMGPSGVMVKIKSRFFCRLYRAENPRRGPSTLQLTLRLREMLPESRG